MRIISYLTHRKEDLLSFDAVTAIVNPESAMDKGIQAVPVSLIVGSEGRYRDFDKEFLPRHRSLQKGWGRVDMAYCQYKDIPPVKLYKIGGLYFVSDGNHRVSVAKYHGVEWIDAEVIELSFEANFKPGSTKDELRKAVVNYEKQGFFNQTQLDKLRPGCNIDFTETGHYKEVLKHINRQKDFNNKIEKVSFKDKVLSWYDTVYLPFVKFVRREDLLSRSTGRTEADLYVWFAKCCNELKNKEGTGYSGNKAYKIFNKKFKKNIAYIFLQELKGIFTAFLKNGISREKVLLQNHRGEKND